MRAFTFGMLLILTGCTAAKQVTPATGQSMTAKPWSVWVHSTADQNISTVSATLAAATCANGVVGPACFNGSALSSTTDSGGTPQSLMVGVASDPVQGYGGPFNFLYVYNAPSGTWNIVGSGQFYSNGNVAGTWQCDSSTPACFGMTGQFTAGPL